MAESQVPYLYDGAEANIKRDLSTARFYPYLKAAGFNERYAFGLYLYNARLSKAFLYPLHILEVTLRNRMSDIFSTEFSDEWYDDIAFRSALSEESLDALDRGIRRAKKRKKADIVATLTFDFWSNLFRPEYDRSFWQKNMTVLLPNAHKTRKDFEKEVKDINDFRNRIAHYEPIHKINLSIVYANIIEAISLLSTETCRWVKHYSTVNACLRTKPSPKGEHLPTAGDRCDEKFQYVMLNESVSKIGNSEFTLCVDAQNNIKAVVNRDHLARYLILKIEDEELLLDLKIHTLSNLVGTLKINNNFNCCSAFEPYNIIEKYFNKSTNFLIIFDAYVPKGIIEKSHRRY